METRVAVGCTMRGHGLVQPCPLPFSVSRRLRSAATSPLPHPPLERCTRSLSEGPPSSSRPRGSARGSSASGVSSRSDDPNSSSADSREGLPLVIPEVVTGGHSDAAPEEGTPHWRGTGPGAASRDQRHTAQPTQPAQPLPLQRQREQMRADAPLHTVCKRDEALQGQAGRGLGPSGVPHGTAHGRPARWAALFFLPAMVWGMAWLLTSGLLSASYAALAAAANIAATAFCGLAPVPAATAVAAGPDAAAATAVAVAAVDWVDVALRTAAGLAGNAGGRDQVLATLQEAGASPSASWGVRVLLPGLCVTAAVLREAAIAMQSGLPGLGSLVQLSTVAVGTGFLLVMVVPLRPYLAPLLPLLPKARPPASTLAAVQAGGIACMVAVLTELQCSEVAAPSLGPSVQGTMAAAAASSPLLLQHQALLYAVIAVASDVLLAACTVVVAAGRLAGRRELWSIRGLAVARLLLDLMLLAAVGTGHLGGKISAVRLLGVLWLFQTVLQT